METSAELLYLLKFADKNDVFGFKDELERSQALQWLFFWHGSGAPYQGQVNHFGKFAKEKIPCAYTPSCILHILSLSPHQKVQHSNAIVETQTPSSVSAMKPSASMVCSRFN